MTKGDLRIDDQQDYLYKTVVATWSHIRTQELTWKNSLGFFSILFLGNWSASKLEDKEKSRERERPYPFDASGPIMYKGSHQALTFEEQASYRGGYESTDMYPTRRLLRSLDVNCWVVLGWLARLGHVSEHEISGGFLRCTTLAATVGEDF